MLRLGSVAGFAVDVGVFAGFFHVQDVGVTCLTSVMTGVVDGVGGDFADGGGAVVSILAKTGRHYKAANHPEGKKRNHKKRGEAKQMR